MRFPQTAALIQAEGADILDAIFAHEDFKTLLQQKTQEAFMASVQDLKGALDSAKASFDDLVGKVGQSQGGIDPAELDPILSEIKDLQGKIDDVKASLPSKAEATTVGQVPAASGDADAQAASASGAAGSLTP